MSTEICSNGNYEKAQFLKFYLHQMTTKKNVEIVTDLIKAGNAPNWTYNPEIWSNEIQKIKWSLQEEIYKSNPAEELFLCVINNMIWRYIPPIIILLGTLGNLLSFVVLWNFSGKTVSTFIYLSLLSIVDQLVLIFGLMRRWINHLISTKLEDNSSSLCKLSQFLGTTTSVLSVWLIVAVTLERTIVIIFPFKAPTLVKKQRAYIVSTVMTILILVIYFHFLFTVDLEKTPFILENSVNVTICKFKEEYDTFLSYWVLIDAIIYSFFPLICIFIFNIIILVKVCKAGKNRRMLTTYKSGKRTSMGSESTRQLTMMLLLISGTFLITTTPIFIVKIISLSPKLWKQPSAIKADVSIKEIAVYQLADSIAEILMHVNHAMNFYLYCASGNKFRSCLKSLFRKWFSCFLYNREMEHTQISLFTQTVRHQGIDEHKKGKAKVKTNKRRKMDYNQTFQNEEDHENTEELI